MLWIIEGGTHDEEKRRLDAMFRAGAVMRNPYYVTFTDLVLRTGEAILIGKDGHPSNLTDG